MEIATRWLNLVFQGGGVRGIAYAGGLARMPAHYRIHAVGGTSAGSIVAALLGIGKRGDKLKKLLESPALFDFLDPAEAARFQRIEQAFADGLTLCAELSRLRKLSNFKLWNFKRKHKSLVADLSEAWAIRGFHRADRLRTWLDEVLEGKSFKDIEVEELKIVAADVSEREYAVYSKKKYPEMKLAEAVHRSISIPIFFAPFTAGTNHFVDGGVLSNFPSYLFVKEKYPTIGFRLGEISASATINTTLDYLKNLLLTMAEAHDKQRAAPPYFKAYSIFVTSRIPSTKFSLTQNDLDELYQAGLAVGESVDWERYSSPAAKNSYYDPQPYEALKFSLSNAHRLWESYANKELWVDTLDQDTVMTVKIEGDWTIQYDGYRKLTVTGLKSLFVSRLSLFGSIPGETEEGTSIAEIPHTCEEISATGAKQLIRIPAFNDDNRKGFVVVYVPPVSEDSGVRTFHTGFKVNREFAESVGKGKEDEITYSVRQVADEQYQRLKLRILVDVGLPLLEFQSPYQVIEHKAEYDEPTHRTYRVYECQTERIRVVGEQTYRVGCKQKGHGI